MPGPGWELIDADVHADVIGVYSQVGYVIETWKGPSGQMTRVRKSLHVVAGCNHILKCAGGAEDEDGHLRKDEEIAAGFCVYCADKYQQELLRNKITPQEAERLALVCRACARTTVSGALCCPKHWRQVKQADGTIQYLDEKQIREQQRQGTVTSALAAVVSLFGVKPPDPPTPQQKEPPK
jgi:hypothetical protein